MSWTKQQLSARVQQLRRVIPMTTSMAHAVIAHQHGIKIDRYLEHDELERVRDVVAKLPTNSTLSGAQRGSAARGSTTGKPDRRPRTIVFPNKIKLLDPLLSGAKIQEAREMAAVYPLLYVLENSMREVVQRVMRHKYGTDWWDTALTNGKMKTLKANSDARRAKEAKKSWHQRRGEHPIDYIDLGQLGEIVIGKQDDFFPLVLGDNRDWFEHSLMPELVLSRNVLCHMNPLDANNVTDVGVKATRWHKLVAERRDYIPDA
jgi:hypothetical protein